jgi:chromosome segregation ATPase
MKSMAESAGVMGRLKQVERDVADLKQTAVQISEILVDLAERMDHGFESLGERLDRLITATIEERTASTDRLRDIERRLSRLEDRVGPA